MDNKDRLLEMFEKVCNIKLIKESIDDDINYIYSSNPELSKIGNKYKYIEYLKTIYPNSKIKNIVYHGAMEKLLPNDEFNGNVTYFTTSKKYAETFGIPIDRKVLSAKINIINPYKAPSELADVPKEIHDSDQFTNPRIIKANTNKYDSVIGIDAGQKDGITIAVFNPNQIHILGSKKDIENFRKYLLL